MWISSLWAVRPCIYHIFQHLTNWLIFCRTSRASTVYNLHDHPFIFPATRSHFAIVKQIDLHPHAILWDLCLVRCHLHSLLVRGGANGLHMGGVESSTHWDPPLSSSNGSSQWIHICELWMESILPSKGPCGLGFSWVGWLVLPCPPPFSTDVVATLLFFQRVVPCNFMLV